MGRGERHDVGAVVSSVGNERDCAGAHDVEQSFGACQVGVTHDHVLEPIGGDAFHPVVDGAVETEARTPDHLCAHPLCPRSHPVVVTGNERGNLGDHVEDAARHPLRESGPVRVGEHAPQAAFGSRESLDRDQDGEMHWGHCRRARESVTTPQYGDVRRNGRPVDHISAAAGTA